MVMESDRVRHKGMPLTLCAAYRVGVMKRIYFLPKEESGRNVL